MEILYQILPYILTAIASLAGTWVAIESKLKVHHWRLDEQKVLLLDHIKKHESHESRLTYLEAQHGITDRRRA